MAVGNKRIDHNEFQAVNAIHVGVGVDKHVMSSSVHTAYHSFVGSVIFFLFNVTKVISRRKRNPLWFLIISCLLEVDVYYPVCFLNV